MFRVGYVFKDGKIGHENFNSEDGAMEFVIDHLDNLKRYRIMNVETKEIIETDTYRRDNNG